MASLGNTIVNGTLRVNGKVYSSDTIVGNITGTAGSTKALANYYDSRQASMNVQLGDGTLRHFYATSATTTGKPDIGDAHIIHSSWDANNGYDAQLAIGPRGAGMQFRGQDAGTWSSWRTVLTNVNAHSYGANKYVTFTVAASARSADSKYYPNQWKADLGIVPTDGMQITFKLPAAGHDYGTFVSLNNGTNYYPLILSTQDNTRLTTHFGSGRIVTAIYSSTQTADTMFPIAGSASRVNVTGGFVIQSSYRDGNTVSQIREENGRIIAGTNGITPYTIVALDNANRYQSLTLATNAGTGTSKTMNTAAKFKLDPVLRYYGANNSATNGNTVSSTYATYSAFAVVDSRYSHNHTVTFAVNTPLYIECTVSGGYWSPTSVGITQTFRTGYYYIFLGNTYSTEYQFCLAADHPVYYYDGTNLTTPGSVASTDNSVNNIISLTKAQYNALTTKEKNTLYNITDDSVETGISSATETEITAVFTEVFG